MESGRGQSVTANIITDNSPGPVIPNDMAQHGRQELSNVDIVNEITQFNSSQIGYNANLKVLETNFQLQGTLINMIV